MFVQGEGSLHPARNGKEATACWLYFVLCRWGGRALLIPGDRGREILWGCRSAEQTHEHKLQRSLEKEAPGGGSFGFLCSVTLAFLPSQTPICDQHSYRRGFGIVIVHGKLLPVPNIKRMSGFKNIMLLPFSIFFYFVYLKILIKSSSRY